MLLWTLHLSQISILRHRMTKWSNQTKHKTNWTDTEVTGYGRLWYLLMLLGVLDSLNYGPSGLPILLQSSHIPKRQLAQTLRLETTKEYLSRRRTTELSGGGYLSWSIFKQHRCRNIHPLPIVIKTGLFFYNRWRNSSQGCHDEQNDRCRRIIRKWRTNWS